MRRMNIARARDVLSIAATAALISCGVVISPSPTRAAPAADDAQICARSERDLELRQGERHLRRARG